MKGKHKQEKNGLKKRCRLKWRLPVRGEEIKERTKVKKTKVQRRESRINQYQQNRTFKNNQGKYCRKLNSGRKNYETIEVSDKKAAHEFLESIWGERKEHQKDVE